MSTIEERLCNCRVALVLRADGTELEVTPKNGQNFTLEEMQGYVNGFIERVRVGEKLEMWVNEDARLKPEPKVNAKATVIYCGGRISEAGAADASPYHPATIVGDVLIGHYTLFRDPEELEEKGIDELI